MIPFVAAILAFANLVAILCLAHRFNALEHFMSATSTDVSNQLTADGQKLDQLVARIPEPSTPEDLQPLLDQAKALGDKIDAVLPAAPTA